MVGWVLAAVSGLLCYLWLPPQGFYLLGWCAYLPVLWAHRETSPKRAFLLGWLTGAVANLGGFYWVYELMVTHSDIPALGALGLTLFMAAQHGLREAIWLGLARRLSLREGPSVLLLYPTLYVACEFLYPIIFPFYLANSQHNCLWTSQFFDLAGPAGLSFVLMLFQICLWQLAEDRRRRLPLITAVIAMVGTVSYGIVRVNQIEAQLKTAPQWTITMVENDVGIIANGVQVMESLERLQTLSAQAIAEHQPDLLVFPETSVKTPPPSFELPGETGWQPPTSLFYPLHASRFSQSERFSPQLNHQTPVLFGTTGVDPNRKSPIPNRPAVFNAAFLLDENGEVVGTALKNKLLLFGEFIPGSQYFPWIYTKFLTRASSLTPGDQPACVPFRGERLGISICYEDILPAFNYQLGRQNPTLLLNLTNDAWFGKTAEPAAHLALAKARAIELRRSLVRSTTTGISAFIDPLGRVVQSSRLDGPEALTEQVHLMRGATLFSWIGTSFAWLCVLISIFWMLTRRKETGSGLEQKEK